jgi:hypothetical protein
MSLNWNVASVFVTVSNFCQVFRFVETSIRQEGNRGG